MRIAFITQTAYQNFQSEMLSGVMKAAEKHNADIIRFSLSVSIDYFPDEKILNKLLENICAICEQIEVDGLLLLSWIAPPEIITKYLSRKAGIPIVVLGKNLADYPSVYQDGDFYVKELVKHLKEEHKCEKIAYIEPTNPDSRLNGYSDKMKEYGIFDPAYIITNEDIGYKPYFGFLDRAERIISCIFDEKKLRPDAMMVMHSNDAVGIIDRLKARGIRVPEDIAVTSWEEGDLCRYNNPPVTTVYFPFAEMGNIGCDTLAKIIKGEKTEHSYIAPSRIIKRSSCGCGKLIRSRIEIPAGIKSEKEIKKILDTTLSILDTDKLLDAFSSAVAKNDGEYFTAWLKQFIESRFVSIEHIKLVQEDILLLRQIIDNTAEEMYSRNKLINDIWINSLLMLNGEINTIIGKKERYKLQYASKAERISLYLSTMFSLDKIKTILSRYLPKIKINKCVIYETEPENRSGNNYKLLYNYTNGSELPDDGGTFGSQLFSDDKCHVYNVHLLEVNLDIIGCVFFDYAVKDDRIYLTLATQLASAINGTKTLEILKDSVAEKEMLMKELQHRVKNNLVMIISMLTFQSDKIKDDNIKQIFSEANNKIRSMALIYDKLYKPSSNLQDVRLDEYLDSLSDQLLNYFNFQGSKVKLISELDNISIDLKRCIYIGLITNEILTNSFKYAFPEKSGIISIRLKQDENAVLLEFSDNGIGIGDKHTTPQDPDSFGLELVKINVRQLKGKIEINSPESGGTNVAITFPYGKLSAISGC